MKRAARRIVVVLLALFVIGVAFILWASNTPPAWYNPPDRHNAEAEQLADDFEYRLIEEAQKIRKPARQWTVRIRESHLNMWLATRLPQWIEHHHDMDWPPHLDTPQAHIEPDGISLAIDLRGDDSSHIVVARFMPSLNDGALSVRTTRLAVGRLAVPGDPAAKLAKRLRDARGDQSSKDESLVALVQRVLTGEDTLDPVFELSDGRRVRLVALQLHNGAMDATNETLANDQP